MVHERKNTATFYVDDDKFAQTLTFHPHQMRRSFEAFPEVVMIDATHNTNDARYKLFSFMIHDVFGHVSTYASATRLTPVYLLPNYLWYFVYVILCDCCAAVGLDCDYCVAVCL